MVYPDSQAHCYEILDEALRLITTQPGTPDSQKRLSFLLLEYFQDDHATSADFRSTICYGRVGLQVTMDQFNKYVILPSSHYEFFLGEPVAHVPVQFQATDTKQKHALKSSTLSLACETINFILDHIALHHVRSTDLNYYRRLKAPPITWFHSIVGVTDRSAKVDLVLPSLEELRVRVEKSISYSFSAKAANPKVHFFSPASGMAWCPASDVEVEEHNFEDLVLEACSKFPAHLSILLQEDGQYLDELAGVHIPYFDPMVAARFQSMYDQSPSRHLEGIDLMRGKDSHKLGGTTLALHQYLSPAFLAYYTADQDSCSYMQDIRSSHKKDRKVRVASTRHDNSKPIWLQFGATSDVFLYLSQTASVGEQLWLTVVNFVTRLLMAYINSELKKGFLGKRVPKNQLVTLPVFTELVLNASVPKDGNFGPHDDNKPGLSHAADPRYSGSNLIVPTLCIQNYAQATTSVSWAPKDDPSHIAGVVFQECTLVHFQLLCVQEYFIHWVKTNKDTIAPHKFYCFDTPADVIPEPVPIPEPDEGNQPIQELAYDMVVGVLGCSTGDVKSLATSMSHDIVNEADEVCGVENDLLLVGTSLKAIQVKQVRLVASARATSAKLQNLGINEIFDCLHDKTITSQPKVFGFDHHYVYRNVWGATSSKHHDRVGTQFTLPNSSTDYNDAMQPSLFCNIFKPRSMAKKPKVANLGRRCNLDQYRCQLRTIDKPIWPKSNMKKVISVKSAATMMISRPIVDLLLSDGILPVIKHPRKSVAEVNTSFLHIPFGPYLDDDNQPHLPGVCFDAGTIYWQYGMKLLKGHNEAWRSTPASASGVFVRLVEKNGLPMDLPDQKEDRLSPIAEMVRIIDGKERKGFPIHRSGGNPTLKGSAPPAEAARSAGEGAFFEHEQSIRNPYNFALEILCEHGTPVTVWGGGDLFPKKYHDQRLEKDIDSAEQVFYFGCYKLKPMVEFPALTKSQIEEIMIEYGALYDTKLVFSNLRFRLKPYRGYMLVPLNYPAVKDGYRALEIDVRDNRRPTFDLPVHLSFEKAFGVGNKEQFDETTMLTQWFQNGGHHDFIHNSYVHTTGRKRRGTKSTIIDMEVDDSMVHESAFRLLLPDEAKAGSGKLSEFETRSRTSKDQWQIVMECGIASFLRLCKVNIDSGGKVGPLLDPNAYYHNEKNQSCLLNYANILGPGQLMPSYMKQLGLEVQRAPTTHPLRTYDPSRLLLMDGNGGGYMRATRKGISFVIEKNEASVDMLFQCFMIEVVRVPILIEWSKYQHESGDGSGGFKRTILPTIRDIDSLLDFVDDLLVQNDFRTTRHIVQTQYVIHDAFKDHSAFARVLKFVAREFTQWVKDIVRWVSQRTLICESDTFSYCIESLAELLSRVEGLGPCGDKIHFFCQHVLMNMNEIIDDWPFGPPTKAIFGFGGLFGARRLARGSGYGTTTPQQMLVRQLDYVKDRPTSELKLVGMELHKEEGVLVSENHRPVCILDTEHWGCLDFSYTERGAGGSRGIGNHYGVTFPHCHPVPTTSFSESVAVAAIKQFQTEVDGSSWAGPEVVTAIMVRGVGGDSMDGEEVEDDGVGAFESDDASCNTKEKSLPMDGRVRMIATEPVLHDQLLTKDHPVATEAPSKRTRLNQYPK